MFTGLVEALAEVVDVRSAPPGKQLTIDAQTLAEGAQPGDSIAVSGCCLTVVAIQENQLTFEAGPETLQKTTLGELVAGAKVNLERSLRLSDRLGGHLVTGHVDGCGHLVQRKVDGDWAFLHFQAPRALTVQMASKGSVAVDGVSLTLVDVSDEGFSVALIPHTLAVTTLGALGVGSRVNLETDLLAKYVQRQLNSTGSQRG